MPKVTVFIPFNQPDLNGDVFSPDCKFTWPNGVSELHRNNNGVTIIKSCRLDEVSLLPDGTYGVGLSNVILEGDE